MPTYAMLARPSPEALVRPGSAVELNRQVEDRIKSGCPGVRWLANCAVMGPCDYLDVIEAPDVDTATKVRCWSARSGMLPRKPGSSRRGSALWIWPRTSRANR
jgi:GYD domain